MSEEKKILQGYVKDLDWEVWRTAQRRRVDFKVPFMLDKRPLTEALRAAIAKLAALGCFQTLEEIAALGEEPAALVRAARSAPNPK